MDPILVSFISALTALVASILGPLVTLRAARVQFNASVLSSNRQKWIDALRDLIAHFQSQLVGASIARETLAGMGPKEVSADPLILARAEQLILTMSKIRLMINPMENDHQALVAWMDQGVKLVRSAPLGQDIEPDIEAIVEGLTRTSQSILKREWSRVKRGR